MDDLKMADFTLAAPPSLMATPPLIEGDAAGAWLPRTAPRPMPEQNFQRGKLYAHPPASSPFDIALRRIFIFGTALSLGAIGTWIIADSLSWHGLQPLEIVFIALFGFLFTWMSFAFLSFCMGLWTLHYGEDDLGLTPAGPFPTLKHRTAILMPICNEDADGVVQRIQAMRRSLARTGQGGHFDFFVLSDTRDAEALAAERVAMRLFSRSDKELPVYYRRRLINTDRKTGNIADWVTRFGYAYAHMVLLDADSLMTGDTLVRLAGGMEANSSVGLIQTAPRLINQKTLFARAEQFAAGLYGPAAACGIAWWSGAECNYWGHNAIIRVRAFAESCGLPHLSGRAPFGGHIMSHDFVEAALLRRAGWAVHMAPRLGGSYEESPPTLMDTLQRDRRWCQGNLQHAALLNASGFHWINRFHLLRGILNYLIAPIWLAMVTIGAILTVSNANADDMSGLGLPVMLAVTVSFLVLPKVLAFLALYGPEDNKARFGDSLDAGLSVVAETVISTLLTPVVMLTHTAIVISVLTGRKSGWKSQRRSGYAVCPRELGMRFGFHTLVGIGLAIVVGLFAPAALTIMATIIISLTLSVPMVALTSANTPPILMDLFRIPEEPRVPVIWHVPSLSDFNWPGLSQLTNRLSFFPDLQRAGLKRFPKV